MLSQYVCGALGEVLGGQPRTHRGGVDQRSGAAGPDGTLPVRADRGTTEVQLQRPAITNDDGGEGGDRSAAARLERGEQRPLRDHRGVGVLVVEAGQQLNEAV